MSRERAEKNSLVLGCFAACVAAGPTYVVTYLFATYYLGLSDAPDIAIGRLVFSPALIFFSVPFGALAALLPVVLGAHFMRALSDRFIAGRHHSAWLIAGALFGFLITLVLDALARTPAVALALIFTSATCSLTCRFNLSWD